DPLAARERDDRDADREPDEEQLEQVVACRAVPDVGQDARAPAVGCDEGERAADPERVRDPVEDRGDPSVEAAEGELRPLVRAALLREGAPDLGHHERVREHEGEREYEEPGEALASGCRDETERVEAYERRPGRTACRSGGAPS